jgi:hypothetical protein
MGHHIKEARPKAKIFERYLKSKGNERLFVDVETMGI